MCSTSLARCIKLSWVSCLWIPAMGVCINDLLLISPTIGLTFFTFSRFGLVCSAVLGLLSVLLVFAFVLTREFVFLSFNGGNIFMRLCSNCFDTDTLACLRGLPFCKTSFFSLRSCSLASISSNGTDDFGSSESAIASYKMIQNNLAAIVHTIITKTVQPVVNNRTKRHSTMAAISPPVRPLLCSLTPAIILNSIYQSNKQTG